MNLLLPRRVPPGALLLAALFAAGCHATAAGGAGAAGRAAPAPPRSAADVAFMTDMIAHHAQALKLAALVPARTATEALRTIAERIAVSQEDEIAMMRSWLRERGEPAPDPEAALARMSEHAGHHARMPGMLTPEELARLEAASGARFDSLFLASMIRHHEGALVMVDRLFDTPGAAQDETVYRFASDVFADQAAEIERMEALLAQLRREEPQP